MTTRGGSTPSSTCCASCAPRTRAPRRPRRRPPPPSRVTRRYSEALPHPHRHRCCRAPVLPRVRALPRFVRGGDHAKRGDGHADAQRARRSVHHASMGRGRAHRHASRARVSHLVDAELQLQARAVRSDRVPRIRASPGVPLLLAREPALLQRRVRRGISRDARPPPRLRLRDTVLHLHPGAHRVSGQLTHIAFGRCFDIRKFGNSKPLQSGGVGAP